MRQHNINLHVGFHVMKKENYWLLRSGCHWY